MRTTKALIVHQIDEFKKKHYSYKDGGIAFVDGLSNMIDNLEEVEKSPFIDHFLAELDNEVHGHFYIAIQIFKRIKVSGLCDKFLASYNNNANYTDEKKREAFYELFIAKKCADASKELEKRIEKELADSPIESYFIIVQYCNLNQEKGYEYLANLILDNKSNDEFKLLLNRRISFLGSSFLNGQDTYIVDFLKHLSSKDIEAGIKLKGLIIDFLNSSISYPHPKREKLLEEISQIDRL